VIGFETARSGSLPYGRLLRKTLLYGRLFRTEDFSVRKSLPYGRVFRAEESSVRKSLPYGRLFRMQDVFVRKGLPCGRLFRTEESFVRKTLQYGRVFLTGHAVRKWRTLNPSDFKKTRVSAGSAFFLFPWRSVLSTEKCRSSFLDSSQKRATLELR